MKKRTFRILVVATLVGGLCGAVPAIAQERIGSKAAGRSASISSKAPGLGSSTQGSAGRVPSGLGAKAPAFNNSRNGIGNMNGAAANGRDVAGRVAAGLAGQGVFQQGAGYGPQGRGAGSHGMPDMTLGGSGFGGREIRNPLDRSSGSGYGMTDIRGGASSQNKGRETGGSHLSRRGESLLGVYGPRDGQTQYGSTHSPTGESTHVGHSVSRDRNSSATVTEHRDTSGRLSSTTLETGHSGTRSTDYKAVHFDSQGRSQDIVVVRENNRTHEQTKDVYGPSGNQQSHSSSRDIPTPRDTTPADGNGSKGTQSCDRSPTEGGSLGGLGAPNAKQVAGISNIDLLRQRAEGQSTAGGPNTMTSGRIRSSQVRPDSAGTQPRTNRSLGSPNVTNPETTGGYTGGGDRPD